MTEDEILSSDASSAMEESETKEQYQSLCAGLNMDSDTLEEAWRSYNQTKLKYTLEGDQMHWLACALYVACRRGSLETVGREVVMEGNGVSLTRLLRSARLSLIQFFNKARLWADMCNLKTELVDKIDKLERNFAVSNVIFKKFQPIFVDLFRDPALDPPKPVRSRKQKRPPCTPGELFDFCWTLFIRVKGHFQGISDDLVNSYHLLLSCIDYVYCCAWVDGRDDLLNQTFNPGVEPGQPSCILDCLCTLHDGIIQEVKSIREHYWKPYIKSCIDKKMLRAHEGELGNLGLGILDQAYFDTNCKNLRKDYETYVLSIGEYDERVFLGEEAPQEIGTPSELVTSGNLELGEKIGVIRRNLQNQFEGPTLIPCTPLSGRNYLRARDQAMVTPSATSATYLVERLNKMVAGRKPEPSPSLIKLFKSVGESVQGDIVQRVTTMGEIFTVRYNQNLETRPATHASFAAMRLGKGQILYYRVLEHILLREQRNGKSIDLLVAQSIFHQSLFAVCLEVVIFSHYSQKTFPWILDTFQLEPYNFYKVIEVLIREEEGLVRDVVKHLQRVEEQILESLAWTSSSSVWNILSQSSEQGGVPSCEEAYLPTEDFFPTSGGQSPLSHHMRTPGGSLPVSTGSPIAADRFKSPIVTAVARRQLFSGLQPGQSVLANQGGASVHQGSREQQLSNAPYSPIRSPMRPGRSRRTGGLVLFYRKVYHLAHLRLDNLCFSLQLDLEMKKRIWTCLEWTLRTHPDIIKDRHLDQVIMCVLYVVCKVSGRAYEKNFTDIMKHYRNQPQATSHVYRSVLLGGNRSARSNSPSSSAPFGGTTPVTPAGANPNIGAPPPTPGRMAASSTVGEDGEERGDLIKFYNAVFLPLVQEYALKFKKTSTQPGLMPHLSPLPQLRANPSSPCRKVSESHSVFTRPLKPNNGLLFELHRSPIKPLSYSFSRSPAKNLTAINEMMKNECTRRADARVPKRLLVDEDVDEEESPGGKVVVLEAGATSRPAHSQGLVKLILGETGTTAQ